MKNGHLSRGDIDRRLARLEGHLRAVRRMIREGRDCPELFVQLGTVRGAIEQVGLIVLKDHLTSCFESTGKHRKKVLRLLDKALTRFFG